MHVNWAEAATVNQRDRRQARRTEISVPAFIFREGDSIRTRLLNIVAGGAMFETASDLEVGSELELRCGSIEAECTVVWEKDGLVGVKFSSLLADAEVEEQALRTAAVAERRQRRSLTGSHIS